MQSRINFQKVAPAAYNALMTLSNYLNTTTLDPMHKELIKIRASQINGCAFCLNMHTAEARKAGMSEKHIYLISAWHEADFYTAEEKAILALTEEMTLIGNHVKDETYEKAAALFDEKYLADLITAIIIINSWNRFAITTGLRVS